MRTTIAALIVLAAGTTACGDGDEGGLSKAAREWCSFSAVTEDEALRFDAIFEAGLELELNMDVVNARADALRTEYQGQGMSPDEAVQAVSEDLFEIDEFVQACEAAYLRFGPAGR